jgi:hypothetical protein
MNHDSKGAEGPAARMDGQADLRREPTTIMYYHGSKTGGIRTLIPTQSLHGRDYVYLTSDRNVALIYTVDAIESFYEAHGLLKPPSFHPWYSYGFDGNHALFLDEYYPDATRETYAGKSGYIYRCDKPKESCNPTGIFCVLCSEQAVETLDECYVDDVYEELLKLERAGAIRIHRFEDMGKESLEFIYDLIRQDILNYGLRDKSENDYAVFLHAKFPFLFE